MSSLPPNLTLLAVGKLRAGVEADLFKHYAARLPQGLKMLEVEEKRQLPPAQRTEKEGELLLSALSPQSLCVVLDERGKQLSSIQFAQNLGAWHDQGHKQITFLIGGADGHAQAVRKRADLLLSLSNMTLPHLMVRGILAEQLWRAHSILSAHPYHREG